MAPGQKRSNPFLRRSWAALAANSDADANTDSLDKPARPSKKIKRTAGHAQDDGGVDSSYKSPRGGPASSQRIVAAEKSRAMRMARTRPLDSKAEPHSLRITVHEIVHGTLRHGRVGTVPAAARDGQKTRALCTVTISCSHDSLPQVVRHRESQLCWFEVFRSPNSNHRMAEIILTRPFIIVRESLLVNRGGSLVFADSYELTIELEAGEGPWPLFDPADFGVNPAQNNPFTATPRKWVLRARFVDIFKRPRNVIKVSLLTRHPENQRGTDHYLMVDIAWASLASPAPLNFVANNTTPTANGVTTANGGDVAMDGGHAKEQNKANAQEPADEPEKEVPNTSITYQFPTLAVPLDAFACVACGNSHPSVEVLQAHLQINHEQFEFEMKQVPGKGLVCLIRHRTDDDPTTTTTHNHPFGDQALGRRIGNVDTNKPRRITNVDTPGRINNNANTSGRINSNTKTSDRLNNADTSSRINNTNTPGASKPSALALTISSDASSDQLSLPPLSPLSEPKVLMYGPLVQDIAAIQQDHAHISWFYQTDMSGPKAKSMPKTELAEMWDDWVMSRQLNEKSVPLSLQVELTHLLHARFSSFVTSRALTEALAFRVSFLADTKAIDDAYIDRLRERIHEAAAMGEHGTLLAGNGGSLIDSPQMMRQTSAAVRQSAKSTERDAEKTSAKARRTSMPQLQKPKRPYKRRSLREPPSQKEPYGDVGSSKRPPKTPQPEKAAPSPSRTLPQRSSRGMRKPYIYDPFDMIPRDALENPPSEANDENLDDDGPATAASPQSVVSRATQSPDQPRVKRKRGRPRKHPRPEDSDGSPNQSLLSLAEEPDTSLDPRFVPMASQEPEQVSQEVSAPDTTHATPQTPSNGWRGNSPRPIKRWETINGNTKG